MIAFAGAAGSTYDAFGHPLSETDANGVMTVTAYDGWGRLVSSTLNGVPTDGANLVTTHQYDDAGRDVGYRLPLGNGEAYQLDSADRIVSKTRFDANYNYNERLQFGYNSADELISRDAQVCINPMYNCNAWTTTTASGYAYDTFGELVEINDPATNGTSGTDQKAILYTTQGRPSTYSDENHSNADPRCGPDFATSCATDYGWSYDLAGRATTAVRFLPISGSFSLSNYAVTSYAHNVDDNLTSITDPNGNITTYHYDDFGNMLSETSPVSGTTTYHYDADDNVISEGDASNAITTYTYDALDRRTKSVSVKPGAPVETVSWTYDDAASGHFGIGRLASVTDPAGTTSYTYERRGLVTSNTRTLDGNTFTQRYAYDGNGNRTRMTYADGLTLAYTYDFADRPYGIVQMMSATLSSDARMRARSTGAMSGRSTIVGNPMSRAVAKTPQTTRTEMRSRPRSGITLPVLGITRRAPFSGEYKRLPASRHPLEKLDMQARRALLVLGQIGPMPKATHHMMLDRDIAGTNIVIVASTTYAPFGPLVSQTFGNGTTQTMTLDARYRPASNVLTNAAGTTLASFQYTEDPAGNITGIQDAVDNSYSRTYAYDDENRLTSSQSGSNLWGTATYQYDAMGNMLAQQVGSRANQFTYSGTTAKLSKVTSTDSLAGTISYDGAGNETAITNVANGSALNNVNTFTYSARNELIGVSRPALPTGSAPLGVPSAPALVPVSYKYDGFGRRLTTTVDTITPNVSALPFATVLAKRYSIPGPDGELATETSMSNPGKPAFDYVWMGGKPIAEIDANRTYFDFTDHLDAPIIQTNSSGAVSYEADYEPYGKIYDLRPGLSDLHQPMRLPGQVAEQFETGANGATDLSYNNARWYRPEWGSYSSVDPLEGISMNPYSYGHDRPISTVDPTGLLGFGAFYGGNVDVGNGAIGAGMNSSVGYGSFWDGTILSQGGFLSGGAFAGEPGYEASYPSCPSNINFAASAYAGGGGGPFLTNANNVDDLAGPFKTLSVNAGFGLDIGLQVSVGTTDAGHLIVIGGLVAPGTGPGIGAAVSVYNTTTLTTAGGGHCPCEK